jgi:hypothetical protein
MQPDQHQPEDEPSPAGWRPDARVETLLFEFSRVLAGMDRETLDFFRQRWVRLGSKSPAAETILEVIDGQIALRELRKS